ncbi:MAG: hypothetical protein LKI24_05330 [Acidipropionibacterium sp.]|nr:hypothetical protein [Acidipropionibacterium sp.]
MASISNACARRKGRGSVAPVGDQVIGQSPRLACKFSAAPVSNRAISQEVESPLWRIDTYRSSRAARAFSLASAVSAAAIRLGSFLEIFDHGQDSPPGGELPIHRQDSVEG